MFYLRQEDIWREDLLDMQNKNFCFVGGMRWSSKWGIPLNFTYPFVKLEVKEGEIIINWNLYLFNKNYFLSKRNITSVAIYRGVFSQGIRITQQKPNFPDDIIFWTFQPILLLDVLRENGYPVV